MTNLIGNAVKVRFVTLSAGNESCVAHKQFTNEGEVRVEIDARPLSASEMATLVTPEIARQREKEREHQAAFAAGLGLRAKPVSPPLATSTGSSAASTDSPRLPSALTPVASFAASSALPPRRPTSYAAAVGARLPVASTPFLLGRDLKSQPSVDGSASVKSTSSSIFEASPIACPWCFLPSLHFLMLQFLPNVTRITLCRCAGAAAAAGD